jgi:hypothetical protein
MDFIIFLTVKFNVSIFKLFVNCLEKDQTISGIGRNEKIVKESYLI